MALSTKTKSKLEVTFIYIFIILMFIVIGYPLVWTFMMSINPGTNMLVTQLIPENPTLEHYLWLFTNPSSDYLLWYKNSLIIAVLNSIGSVVITSLIAYAFSRYKFFGRKYGLYLFLLLQMFPALMGMEALYILLTTIGLVDSIWGLLLIYLGGQIPFNAWLVKGYYDTIPRELDEAAKIDGAGHMRIFVTIMLPLAKPILAF